MTTKRPPFDWAGWQDVLDSRAAVLSPLREYLSGYFGAADEPPEGGYKRRPNLGLRLGLEGGKTLAIRPGWRPASRRRITGGWEVTRPGELDPSRVELELLGPGRLLATHLTPGRLYPGRVLLNMAKNREHLRLVADAAHAFLLDPMATFAAGGQADHCCSCGKPLSDEVSRTRGIGPECVKRFAYFMAPPVSAVERYRLDYYRDTGFLPGR